MTAWIVSTSSLFSGIALRLHQTLSKIFYQFPARKQHTIPTYGRITLRGRIGLSIAAASGLEPETSALSTQIPQLIPFL
jgi:hypothetical protein